MPCCDVTHVQFLTHHAFHSWVRNWGSVAMEIREDVQVSCEECHGFKLPFFSKRNNAAVELIIYTAPTKIHKIGADRSMRVKYVVSQLTGKTIRLLKRSKPTFLSWSISLIQASKSTSIYNGMPVIVRTSVYLLFKTHINFRLIQSTV